MKYELETFTQQSTQYQSIETQNQAKEMHATKSIWTNLLFYHWFWLSIASNPDNIHDNNIFIIMTMSDKWEKVWEELTVAFSYLDIIVEDIVKGISAASDSWEGWRRDKR